MDFSHGWQGSKHFSHHLLLPIVLQQEVGSEAKLTHLVYYYSNQKYRSPRICFLAAFTNILYQQFMLTAEQLDQIATRFCHRLTTALLILQMISSQKNNFIQIPTVTNSSSLICVRDQSVHDTNLVNSLLAAVNSGIDVKGFQKEFPMKQSMYAISSSWNTVTYIAVCVWHDLWPSAIFSDDHRVITLKQFKCQVRNK